MEAPVEAPALMATAAAPPAPTQAPAEAEQMMGSTLPQGQEPRPGRLIIKNAEIRLLVEDTDVAIDRATQVVGDLGGYIISSRVWYQPVLGENQKFATVTIGVPSDRFEDALRRLRGIAIRVLDENASGEDVTDQYVDLESRLRNLEATRDRIREFLDQAKTVKEALEVNQQLSSVEAEIEQVKGRMNYLYDRAAYSTITLQIEPKPPEYTPTPTPTATATYTPRPTATATPWRPDETFRDASQTLGNVFRGVVDVGIWGTIVCLPWLIVLAVIAYLAWRFYFRSRRKVKTPPPPPEQVVSPPQPTDHE
jgi:hypothetical protein